MQNAQADYPAAETTPPTLTISHVIRTLREYLPVILLSLAAVAVGYLIVAVIAYILAPSQRVTSLPFRLEFEGAERGEYPNGLRFSSAEIISTPVLLKVFNANDLGRFTTFTDLSQSVFVLESNAAYEELVREYMARLSDPRLNSVDRERIQREYDLKKASLSKDSYALHYLRTRKTDKIPEVLIRKLLHDILKEWARFVSNEQHVLEYRVAVISPDVIANSPVTGNPLIAAEMLRVKTTRVLANIAELRRLPAAELTQTKDRQTLHDIAIRLDEIVRFTLEPLVQRIAGSGLDERAASIRFLETQLAYDERVLAGQQQLAEAARRTLALYMNQPPIGEAAAEESPQAPEGAAGSAQQPVVQPQVTDNFIDRLVQLTANMNDRDYRRTVADGYHRAEMAIIPLQQAVAYDRAILATVRSGGGGDGLTREMVEQQLLATRTDVRNLVAKVHELHRTLSQNLNPSTELMTVTGTPTTRVQRTISIKRLALYGILALSLTLPLVAILCLLHARMREDDAAQSPSATVSR